MVGRCRIRGAQGTEGFRYGRTAMWCRRYLSQSEVSIGLRLATALGFSVSARGQGMIAATHLRRDKKQKVEPIKSGKQTVSACVLRNAVAFTGLVPGPFGHTHLTSPASPVLCVHLREMSEIRGLKGRNFPRSPLQIMRCLVLLSSKCSVPLPQPTPKHCPDNASFAGAIVVCGRVVLWRKCE